MERAAAKEAAKLAAEKQVKAKQAAAAKCRAAETTARRLLVEAAKAARVSKIEKKAAVAAEAKAVRANAEAGEKVEENAAKAPFESVARREVCDDAGRKAKGSSSLPRRLVSFTVPEL